MKRLKYLALATLVAFAACDEGEDIGGGGETGSVTATVTAEGAGVAGVQVNLVGPTTGSQVTPASGTVTFTGVEQGAYAVTISGVPSGFVCSSTSATVSVTAGNLNPSVAFSCSVVRSASVTGQVTAGGQPVEGAVVEVSGPGGTEEHTTGADGRYQATGLVAGDYTITLQAAEIGGITCTETSVNRNVEPGEAEVANFSCGGAQVEATVAIERITDVTGTAVDRSDVEDVIVIQVGIDENDQDVDLLEVFFDYDLTDDDPGILVCEQPLTESDDTGAPARQNDELDVDCVVNTAAFRDAMGMAPALIDTEDGRPFSPVFLNGEVNVRARITTDSGDEEVAIDEVILDNEDNLALAVTNDNADDGEAPDACDVGDDDHPEFAFDDDGFRWIGGDICLTGWPIIYSAPFDPNDPNLDRMTISFETQDGDVEYTLTDTEPGDDGEFFFVLDEDDQIEDDDIVVSDTDPVAPAGGLNTGQDGAEDFEATTVTNFGQEGPSDFIVVFNKELQSGTGAINNVMRVDNERTDPGYLALLPHDVIINDIMPDGDEDFWSDEVELEDASFADFFSGAFMGDFDIMDGDDPWFCVDGFPVADDGDAIDLTEDWCDGDVALRLGWVNDDYDFTQGKVLEDDNPFTDNFSGGDDFSYPGVGLFDPAVTYFIGSADDFDAGDCDFNSGFTAYEECQEELAAFAAASTEVGPDATGADVPEALRQSITNDDIVVVASVMDRLWNVSYLPLTTVPVDSDDFAGSDGSPELTDEGDFTIGHDSTVPEITVVDRPSEGTETDPPVAIGGQVNPSEGDLFHFYVDDEENLADADDGFSGPAVSYFELHHVQSGTSDEDYEDEIVEGADCFAPADGGAPDCYTGFDAITYDSDPADVPELDELGFHTFIRPLTVAEDNDAGTLDGTETFDADPLQGYFWFRAQAWDHAGNESEMTEDLGFDGNLPDEGDPSDADDDIAAEGDGKWYLNDIENPAVGLGLGLLVGGFEAGDEAEIDVAAVDNVDLFRLFVGWNVEISGTEYSVVPLAGNVFISSWGIPIIPEFEDELAMPFYPQFETVGDDGVGEPGPSGTAYCTDAVHAGVLDHASLWDEEEEDITNDECTGASDAETSRGTFGPNGVRVNTDNVELLGQTGNFDPEDVYAQVCYYAEYEADELMIPSATAGAAGSVFKEMFLLEIECTGVGPGDRTTGDAGTSSEGQAFRFVYPDVPAGFPDGGEVVAIFYTENNEIGLVTWIEEP